MFFILFFEIIYEPYVILHSQYFLHSHFSKILFVFDGGDADSIIFSLKISHSHRLGELEKF